MRARLLGVAVTLVIVACGGGSSGGGGSSTKTLATAIIDPTKDTEIKFGSAYIKIPAGAVTKQTEIKVEDTGTRTPDGSPIYRFLPEGTRFQAGKEVEVKLPANGVQNPTIWWSNDAGGTSYFPLPSSKADGEGNVLAWVGHFSLAYVAPQTITSYVFDATPLSCPPYTGTVSVAAVAMHVADRVIPMATACTDVLDACVAYRNTERIVVTLVRLSTTGTAQLEIGDYPVVSPSANVIELASIVQTGKAATVVFQKSNATCGGNAPVLAASGTVTLESLSPLEVEYTGVTFPDGSTVPDGEFVDPHPCPSSNFAPLLQSVVTSACTSASSTWAPTCPTTPVCQ